MALREPRFSKEEYARRGTAIYEQRVRPQVEVGNLGKIVAIDLETGAFEAADDTLTASDRLLARCPDAQIWCVRVGRRGVHRFGLHPPSAGEARSPVSSTLTEKRRCGLSLLARLDNSRRSRRSLTRALPVFG
jgi:hypothetical protein